jgi:hypothetical protein
MTFTDKLIKDIRNGKGFSKTLRGKSPKSGYMVALSDYRERTIPRTKNIERIGYELQEFIKANLFPLLNGAYLGVWVTDKNIVFDVSENLASEVLTKELGRVRKQQAIWDVVNGCEIFI